LAEVSEISGIREAEAKDFHVSVDERDRDKRQAEELNWISDGFESDAGDGAERWLVIESVGKCATQDLKSFLVTVDGERNPLANVERANIVETEDVVGVAVGEENGVQASET